MLSRTHQSWSEILAHMGHWLPAQAPIQHFIHHNTLHAFQEQSFFDAVRSASHFYGARNLLSLDEYRTRYERKVIQAEHLDSVLHDRGYCGEAKVRISENLMEMKESQAQPVGLLNEGIRKGWKRRSGVDLDFRLSQILLRLVSGYLDQGVAFWRMPGASTSSSFLEAIIELEENALLSWVPGPRSLWLEKLKAHRQDEGIDATLANWVGPPEYHARYVQEFLFAFPGWSGMVQQVQSRADLLLDDRKITLRDWVAVALALEDVFLRDAKIKGPLLTVERGGPLMTEPSAVAASEVEELQEIWQLALERSFAQPILVQLAERKKKGLLPIRSPEYQTLFCIDDRECSLRRHLEEVLPSVATFGLPGFFGIDCMYLPENSLVLEQRCPAPMRPRHVVLEVNDTTSRREGGGLIRGFSEILFPRLGMGTVSSLGRMREGTRLVWQRTELPSGSLPLGIFQGRKLGYDWEEAAQRVKGVLRTIGLTENFAPLVVFIGHGATSTNNPHFAAYDCGACSGRPGASNARIIAAMANHVRVRELLAQQGMVIPESTWFIGGVHDTTQDQIEYFELELLPAQHRVQFEKLKAAFELALSRNAQERIPKFEVVDPDLGPAEALKEVEHRALAIFEPRPELNHATNAMCIVADRALTRGFNLDRRSFLQSYRYDQDPSGEILAQILAAAIPVCGGINLEYFFSRVDSEIYGAGTKLPHNVVGLLGVANGTGGDLRTGLPIQMTEMHDPIRLFLVIEQTHSIVCAAIASVPPLKSWVENSWVRVFSLDPKTGQSEEVTRV